MDSSLSSPPRQHGGPGPPPSKHLPRLREMTDSGYHTLQEMGDACEPPITRERVRQLLREYKIHRSPRVYKYYCADCGEHLHRAASRCQACHFARLALGRSQHNCFTCGKVVIRRRGELRRNPKHVFCNHRCKGVWLGRTHGFGTQAAKARSGDDH
jgi:predicted RNA-binding Zn-ribbon protein involved in translation (DUF1610 family)